MISNRPSSNRRPWPRPFIAVARGVTGLLLVAACSTGGSGGGVTPTASAALPTQAVVAPNTSAPATAESPANASGLDACALLTKAEVEAAIGKSVLEPVQQNVPPTYSCDYNDPDTPIFSLASVSVIVSDTTEQAKGMFDQIHENAEDDEAVTGIGQAAYWSQAFGFDALVGRFLVTVDVDPQIADQKNIEQALAAKAIARLPQA